MAQNITNLLVEAQKNGDTDLVQHVVEAMSPEQRAQVAGQLIDDLLADHPRRQ